VALNATTPPLAERELPLASRSWTVIVLVPPTVTAVGLALSVDCVSDALPTATVTGAVAVRAFPASVPEMLTVPGVGGAVNVAV